MSQLRTYAVTHSLHVLPSGKMAPAPNGQVQNSYADRTIEVQALTCDGAIDTVERQTNRMVTWAQRVPCPSTPAHAARAMLAKSTHHFGVCA
jgi:hypothetical protein